MTMRRILTGGLMVAITLLLLFVLLLSNLEGVAFNTRHYQEQFSLLGRPQATNMTAEELLRITGEIWAYLRGQRGDLRVTALIDGRRAPVFDQREQEHMADVRELFRRGYLVRNGGLVLLLLLTITAVWLDKKGKLDKGIAHVFTRAGLGGLMAIALAGLLLYLSFGYCFDRFHLLFFNNDLWRLDPKRHNLIKMFPQEFFFNTTVKFVGRTMLQLTLITGLSSWYLYGKRGKGSR